MNGDFENTTAPSCDYNLGNPTFTADMMNSKAFGAGNELDIMGVCSPYCSSVPGGVRCVGIANGSGITPDKFTMKLTSPMVMGTSYTISFWDHGDDSGLYPPTPVQIGAAIVANSAGTVLYTGPTPTSGVWNQRTFTFVAPNNGQFISVAATTTQWSQVDDFTFDIILPIQLVSFDAEASGSEVKLNWSTATELNSDHFTIERSDDGVSYTTLLTQKASGNSQELLNYLAYDLHPRNSVNYYRLSQTDINGATTYFKTVEVSLNETGIRSLNFFPNPTSGFIHFENLDREIPTTIIVSDMLGNEVMSNMSLCSADLDLHSLPKGMYILHVQHQDQVWSEPVVIE